MNAWWFTAGVLGGLAAGVHAVGGHFDPLRPFLQTPLAPVPKATMHAAWHMVTVALTLAAAALIFLGVAPTTPGAAWLSAFVGAHFVAWGAICLALTLRISTPKRVFALPQWTILLPIGVLSWVGAAQ